MRAPAHTVMPAQAGIHDFLISKPEIKEKHLESYIILTRFPYEEPHILHVEISASNGAFSGTLDFYCNTEDILQIGKALTEFPAKLPDQYVYSIGSNDPAAKSYCYFKFRTYTFDHAGHCALQFSFNRNATPPVEGMSEFSIETEAAAVNRLGRLFERFADLEHLELKWTPNTAELDGISFFHN